MLKIYGRANSINVRKVLWLCEELGVAYDREDWGRGFRPTSDPEFLKINPVGLVPVIDDEGFILRESHAILRYLAAREEADELYPSDLKERARIDQWMDWVSGDSPVPMRGVFIGGFIKQAPWTEPWFIEEGEHGYAHLMTLVDGHLANTGSRHITGDAFTLADIAVGLLANRWFSLDLERPSLPALEAYYETLSERPAFMKHGRNGTP